MALPEYIPDHETQALDRLISQFQGKYNITGFVESLMTLVQELEDHQFIFLASFLIDTAVGDQLRILGSIVGLDRGSFQDETYRLLIKGRISANISGGTPRDVLNLLSIIDPNAVYYETICTINIESGLDFDGYADWELGSGYLSLLLDTKPIGVSFAVYDTSMLLLGELPFRFAPGEDTVFGDGGFADCDDITGEPEPPVGSVPGMWANLITP